MTGLESGRAVIALGSNLGDRMEHLARGMEALGGLLRVERVSRVAETSPEDGDPDQGRYLNAVVVGRTSLPPERLLENLLEVERSLGRTRDRPGAARTLDLDLIFHGTHVIRSPGLRLPHPRWHVRPFVALPVLEVLPEGRDPETGLPLLERVHPDVFEAPLRWVGPLTPHSTLPGGVE
jgi:2-amino-4-hydroxy-6-hydroxymethyldihydropteridine diphosphokinase